MPLPLGEARFLLVGFVGFLPFAVAMSVLIAKNPGFKKRKSVTTLRGWRSGFM